MISPRRYLPDWFPKNTVLPLTEFRWDEWVPEDRLLKLNEAGLNKRRSLLEQQTRKNRPAPATAAGSSSSPAPGKDKGKGKKDSKKRARDSGQDSVSDSASSSSSCSLGYPSIASDVIDAGKATYS